MDICLGKKEDASAIKAIDSSLESDPDRSDYIDSSLSQGTVRVAVQNGKIVGYSVVNDTFFRRPTLELLVVAASYRRKGIGRALLQEAQNSIEAGELWTSTNESNIPMQSLLISEGFEKTGSIENLDPGDPEIVYFKRLIKR